MKGCELRQRALPGPRQGVLPLRPARGSAPEARQGLCPWTPPKGQCPFGNPDSALRAEGLFIEKLMILYFVERRNSKKVLPLAGLPETALLLEDYKADSKLYVKEGIDGMKPKEDELLCINSC